MKLDLINSLFNNVKENKFVKNFMKELSDKLENNVADTGCEFNNLLSDDLVLYDNKITDKFRDKMLIERNNILQEYAKGARVNEDILYIYDISKFTPNSYNLCNCNTGKSNIVITKQMKDLPENATLGSIIRKQKNEFVVDIEATKFVGEKINNMIREKIEEQKQYLNSKRIDGHVYEVHEKYLGRIWLYDLNDNGLDGKEGIEEVDFPEDLYETAKTKDLFIYNSGKYQKQIQ